MTTIPADVSGELTAIGTLILAGGAIITAVLATLALRKQAREVRTIEQQVRDQAEVTAQQADLIQLQAEQGKLQREQLELQRKQLEEDRAVNARQTELINLQMGELQLILEERHRYNWRWRKGQASRVFAKTEVKVSNEGRTPGRSARYRVISLVRNTSEQPIYQVGLCRGPAKEPELLESIGTILPGDEAQASFDIPSDESPWTTSYYINFRDASQTEWINMPDDLLIELPPKFEVPDLAAPPEES